MYFTFALSVPRGSNSGYTVVPVPQPLPIVAPPQPALPSIPAPVVPVADPVVVAVPDPVSVAPVVVTDPVVTS